MHFLLGGNQKLWPDKERVLSIRVGKIQDWPGKKKSLFFALVHSDNYKTFVG